MIEVSDWGLEFDKLASAKGWRFHYAPTSWTFDLGESAFPFKYTISRMIYYTRKEMLQAKDRPF